MCSICTINASAQYTLLKEYSYILHIHLDDSAEDFVDTPPRSVQHLLPRAEKPSASVVDTLLSTMRETVSGLGDGLTEASAQKMIQRLKRTRTGAQLSTSLCTFGSDVVFAGGSRQKIRCQPTSVARRREGVSRGVSRGAAPVATGRPPKTPHIKARKRAHNLAANVAQNRANAKSHGSGH